MNTTAPRKGNRLDRLILAWLAVPEPPPTAAPALTIALWKSVALDMIAKTLAGHRWEAIEDPRLRWAAQYILLARGEIRRIDPDLRANVDFILSPYLPPLPPSRKALAAHDDS
jgi:hypothetical protein